MVQYATATELAGQLGQSVDTYQANQALTLTSGVFSLAANTWFAPTSATYTTLGTPSVSIALPFRPVSAVSAVRINGVAITGFTLIKQTLWRAQGFGSSCLIPPDKVDIDLTHGYAAATDDVKRVVLESAALVYQNPSGLWSETIDDYSAVYPGSRTGSSHGPLSGAAQALAEMYRGTLAA